MIKFLIKKHFKVWGVKYEVDLPPEFIITNHAQERLMERFKCSKEKINKVVIKAWYSKDVINWKLNKKNYQKQSINEKKYKVIFREYMGKIFVFTLRKKRSGLSRQKVLITIY